MNIEQNLSVENSKCAFSIPSGEEIARINFDGTVVHRGKEVQTYQELYKTLVDIVQYRVKK